MITISCTSAIIFISQKSYSENIPSNPTCDNSTLGVYSGSAALEPDWGANKIPIRWYNNNTLITDVTAQESECTYDGTIDVATAPTRTGYNFRGWKVSPQMDFNTLTSLGTGLIGYGKGLNSGWCGYYDTEWHTGGSAFCKENANFHELQPYEWKTTFNTGTVYGMAHCSAKSGDNHNYSWPATYREDWAATLAELDEDTTNEKKYCWCLATGWKPSGENQPKYTPLASLSWVFRYADGSASSCSAICARLCSGRVRDDSGFRAALFSN